MKKITPFLIPFLICTCVSNPKKDYRYIEIPETINTEPNKELSEDEVQHDISQTLFALNKVYSGKWYLPKGEFNGLVENLNTLKAKTTPQKLCEKIDTFFDKVSDNHLSAKFNEKSCFKSLNIRDGLVGKNYYTEKKDLNWNLTLQKKKNKTALLISILGFPKSTNPKWNGFIENVQKNLKKADLVILDMRGNGGGDDTKGFELAGLLAGADLKKPYAKQWTNPAPEALQLFVNTFEYWARQSLKEGKELAQYVVDLKNEYVKMRDEALKTGSVEMNQSMIEKNEDFSLIKSIQKPIYILIDADCASSCESTTDFFEYNALVKTVGENTAGYVHFGNNGNVFLKNSGIKLQMAVSYNSYKDGRFIEKTGITPKIKVPQGQNAMDFAWKDFFGK